MTRSQITHRIHVEEAREGWLGLWTAHTMRKARRQLRIITKR